MIGTASKLNLCSLRAASAGPAAGASSTAGTGAAAGGLPLLFVPGQSPDQHRADSDDDQDQNNIDQVGSQPRKHNDHFLFQLAIGEDYFTVSLFASL